VAVTVLAALIRPGSATAQALVDPAAGFLAQNLNQPAPLLGTTETFPPFFGSTLGFAGAPASYVGVGPGGGGPGVGNPPPAAPPTRETGQNPLLPPILPGAVPAQVGNDRAPAYIITPSIQVSTGFDDNARLTSNRIADSVSELSPGIFVSADSPHLQGVLSSSLLYRKYAQTTDQDQFAATGFGYGLATISPGHLYVDGRASLVQVSPTGNGGFANPALGGLMNPETLLTTSVTPVWRESWGDLVETDLRYNHGSVSSVGALSTTSSSALDATETNQGTLTVAIGKGGGTLSSRLVLSGADIASESTAASDQVRGIAEVQYRINPEIALITRGGYENLRFPNAGLTFIGPIATLGTRLDLTPTSAISIQYGREDGAWGFSGAVRQSLTPRTQLLLSFQRSLGSEQGQILNNLNASRMDSYGNIVDAETALPLALANPELSFDQTGVFRMERADAALEHEFETDSLRLFAFYENQVALSAASASSITRGVQLAWFRTMTPSLRGGVSLGYASGAGNQLLSLGLNLTLNLRQNVDAVLSYQFTDSLTGTSAASPAYIRDYLLAGVRASF
jgi:uncharacterized protein (PEP-CTERM system associated)